MRFTDASRFGGCKMKRTEQVRVRLEKQLQRRAKELGFEVTKTASETSDSRPSLTDDPASAPPTD